MISKASVLWVTGVLLGRQAGRKAGGRWVGEGGRGQVEVAAGGRYWVNWQVVERGEQSTQLLLPLVHACLLALGVNTSLLEEKKQLWLLRNGDALAARTLNSSSWSTFNQFQPQALTLICEKAKWWQWTLWKPNLESLKKKYLWKYLLTDVLRGSKPIFDTKKYLIPRSVERELGDTFEKQWTIFE